MTDVYLTIKAPVSHVSKVKGSRFIGRAVSVRNREAAESFIRNIQKEFHDAAHHCYAYRIGTGHRFEFRIQDDGEPPGTAGQPILDVLAGRNLTDCICVVTRYFGGIKLGTGGLARAYRQSAAETLAGAAVIERFVWDTLNVVFDYDMTGTVMSLLSKYHCRVVDTEYGARTTMQLQIRQSQSRTFQDEMIDQSAGKVMIKAVREH